jgi:two-component system chemotaxis response regulator CheB
MEKNKISVLVIGGSAGSLDVLMQVLPELPAIKTLAIVIVLHRKSSDDMMLEELIAAKSATPIRDTEDKVPLLTGYIYIAPADYHLLFETNGLLSLDASEKINYSRPSIDVSFETAAEAYGANTAAILLSGANSDGTHGLQAIQKAGGVIVVQSPETAEMAFMPKNAIAHTLPDYILDSDQIVAFIKMLAASARRIS